ncbi:MAG: hypothetical protein U0470_13025 [Anaerolineae bacterium]
MCAPSSPTSPSATGPGRHRSCFDALIGFTFDAEDGGTGRAPALDRRAAHHRGPSGGGGRLAAHAPSGDGRLWFVDRPNRAAASTATPGRRRGRPLGAPRPAAVQPMWLKVGLREYAARAANAADAADTADTAASPTTERAPVAAWSNGLRLIGAGAPTDARRPAARCASGRRGGSTTARAARPPGSCAWFRDGGPAVSLGNDRLAALPRSDGGEPAAAGEAGAAVWTAWLEGIVPVDAPAGHGTLESRLVDIGSGAPSGSIRPPIRGRPWAALGTIDVGRSALGARALRRLRVRRPGRRTAPCGSPATVRPGASWPAARCPPPPPRQAGWRSM